MVRGRVGFILALLAAALLAWAAREACSLRFPWPAPAQRPGDWFSADPDGLYHARRVARALEEGGLPAGTDPLLAAPDGAPIPWPPYYDLALATVLRPLAPPPGEARHRFLEHAVATVPMLCGILAAVLAAGGGMLLAGAAGAWLAGGLYALTYGAIHYATPGVGDHHAWVSLLAGAMLLALTLALRRPEARRRALATGFTAGALAGLLLGSWVAALLYVLEVQLVLGILLFVHGRRELPALAPFGLAFHGAALVVLFPAVLASPWTGTRPWDVVDLSWFHPAELALGLLVLLPLPWLRSQAARRRHPWLAAAGLLLLAAVLFLADAGPAAGIREGFAWVSRADEFMAGIAESEPLLGPDRTGTGGLFTWLGFGVLLLPLGFREGVRALRRGAGLEWLPWLVAVPLLLVQALAQRRFADPLALPQAILLAGGLAPLLRGGGRWRLPVLLVLPFLLQAPAMARCAERFADRSELAGTVSAWRQGAWRLLVERLGAEPRIGPVLAPWDLGHAIEWAAERPTVATNFGTYIGEDAWRDPARFLLARDPDAAAAIARRRGATHVLLTSALPAAWPVLHRAAGAGPATARRWEESLAARLAPVGRPLAAAAGPSPGWLRLVHVSPFLEPLPPPVFPAGSEVPCGWLWEVVPGARVQAPAAPPGSRLEVEVEVEYPGGRRYVWHAAATARPEGGAELRVPWATDAANGDGRVLAAHWRLGAAGGELRVPEAAVLAGAAVVPPGL